MTDIIKPNNTDLKELKEAVDSIYSVLSKPPKPSVVKTNKYANNSAYLEIGYIQTQLDRLFLSWDWVIDTPQLIANAIVVSGRLIVLTHNGNKITRSGIGAAEIQTKKGSTALTPETINSKAIERDAPKAESEALKNAAKKLGNAFGRGLNRDFSMEHIPDETIIDKLFGNPKNTQSDATTTTATE